MRFRNHPPPFSQKEFFRKPTRPSLPLRKAPPLTPALSPQERGRKPPSVLTFLPLRLSCKESSTSNQAFLLRRKDVTALRCSEPLRSKVGGPSKVFAMLCGMGPSGTQCIFHLKNVRMLFSVNHQYCIKWGK